MEKPKKQKEIWKYKGEIVASKEEFEFCYWLDEALSAGIIVFWEFIKDKSFPLFPKATRPILKLLKTKTKPHAQSIQQHVYTGDFRFKPVEKFSVMFDHRLTLDGDGCAWVDTKGGNMYDKHGGKRIFSVNQKWVWSEHGVWINKIVPELWFHKTWVPISIAFKKNTKRPTIKKGYAGCRFIGDLREMEAEANALCR